MEPSRSSSSHFPSSARSATHFSSTKSPSASTDQAPSSTESNCLLSAQPFVKKYAWAVVGAFIAISGSMVLLACSSSAPSTAKQARRCSSTGGAHRRGLASQEVQRSRALITHSQGTNTEAPEGAERGAEATITQATEKGKERVIEDADVCSAVPEVIIRDTIDSACVHALIDTDTIDRSAPLTIYSSLTCTASDTIRRPVSWSEPYNNKEELETFTSYHSQALEEPLKPHTHTPTQRKNIPILGPSPLKPRHDTTISSDPHPPSSNKAPCLPPTTTRPSFSSKFKETLDSYPCFALSWSQVRVDLFLLLSIFSFLFYYFYLKRDIQKHIEIQPVKPFPIFRMFP